jgi:sec-independent protein translocase protein TatA
MLSTLAFFQNMGVTELIIILVIILLLFGSTKLPSLARSIGSSVNEFKKGMKDGKEDPNAVPPADDKKAEVAEKK